VIVLIVNLFLKMSNAKLNVLLKVWNALSVKRGILPVNRFISGIYKEKQLKRKGFRKEVALN